jgi:SAM-dependent methyltransferase
MQPTDPRLLKLEQASTPPLDNLVGAARAWKEWPEGMDFLNPESPVFAQKALERELYMHHWAPWLVASGTVLDIGGGIGRFACPLLDKGLDVTLVDPDPISLERAGFHGEGRKGKLTLCWGTSETLPQNKLFDMALAAEVLCYVEDPVLSLQRIASVLKPGAPLLFSVEARWGWGLCMDAAPGTLEAWLDNGVVHAPHDRWVRSFTREALEELFRGWKLVFLLETHYVCSGPFEMAGGSLSLPELLKLEDRLRSHPIAAPLHRAWTGVAVKCV